VQSRSFVATPRINRSRRSVIEVGVRFNIRKDDGDLLCDGIITTSHRSRKLGAEPVEIRRRQL